MVRTISNAMPAAMVLIPRITVDLPAARRLVHTASISPTVSATPGHRRWSGLRYVEVFRQRGIGDGGDSPPGGRGRWPVGSAHSQDWRHLFAAISERTVTEP